MAKPREAPKEGNSNRSDKSSNNKKSKSVSKAKDGKGKPASTAPAATKKSGHGTKSVQPGGKPGKSATSSLFSVVSAAVAACRRQDSTETDKAKAEAEETKMKTATTASEPNFTITAIAVTEKGVTAAVSCGDVATPQESHQVVPSEALSSLPTPSIPLVSVVPETETDKERQSEHLLMGSPVAVPSGTMMMIPSFDADHMGCQREDSQQWRFNATAADESPFAQQGLLSPIDLPPVTIEAISSLRGHANSPEGGKLEQAKVKQQQPLLVKLKGAESKKMATGGINQFDLDIVKTAAVECPTPTATQAGDRRDRRRPRSQAPTDLLRPGAGILSRALQCERTLTGLPVNTDKCGRLNTLADESKKRADLQKSPNRRASEMLIVMDVPFNQVSLITAHLALTGAWGVVAERLAAFPLKIACVINATYEAPLLVVEGIESYRIPVADSKKENLSIYLEEVTEKMHTFEVKGQASLVHCMAGVSRSASVVIAYLIRYHEAKMNLEEAFSHTKAARPMINPNLAFLEQLAAFEAKYRPAERCSPWAEHTENGVTKRLPLFVIERFLEDYQVEFDPGQ